MWQTCALGFDLPMVEVITLACRLPIVAHGERTSNAAVEARQSFIRIHRKRKIVRQENVYSNTHSFTKFLAGHRDRRRCRKLLV
jgi:hypothetical protein